MKKVIYRCDCCGKKFDQWDEQEGFGLYYNVGYGSKYDGEIIDIDLCCGCFDSIVDSIAERQKTWRDS